MVARFGKNYVLIEEFARQQILLGGEILSMISLLHRPL